MIEAANIKVGDSGWYWISSEKSPSFYEVYHKDEDYFHVQDFMENGKEIKIFNTAFVSLYETEELCVKDIFELIKLCLTTETFKNNRHLKSFYKKLEIRNRIIKLKKLKKCNR